MANQKHGFSEIDDVNCLRHLLRSTKFMIFKKKLLFSFMYARRVFCFVFEFSFPSLMIAIRVADPDGSESALREKTGSGLGSDRQEKARFYS